MWYKNKQKKMTKALSSFNLISFKNSEVYNQALLSSEKYHAFLMFN